MSSKENLDQILSEHFPYVSAYVAPSNIWIYVNIKAEADLLPWNWSNYNKARKQEYDVSFIYESVVWLSDYLK